MQTFITDASCNIGINFVSNFRSLQHAWNPVQLWIILNIHFSDKHNFPVFLILTFVSTKIHLHKYIL